MLRRKPVKSIITLSGGLDSVVLLHWLCKEPERHGLDEPPALALHFNCGVKASAAMEMQAKYHADKLEVPFVSVSTRFWESGRLFDGRAPKQKQRPENADTKADDKFWSNTFDYQDGRGMIFLSIAAAYAGRVGARYIFLAHQQEREEREATPSDDSPVLDNGGTFVDAMQEAIDAGGMLKSRAAIYRMPFLDNRMNKSHIVQMGWLLQVEMGRTHSCDYQEVPCGRCTSCVRRSRAIEEAKRATHG